MGKLVIEMSGVGKRYGHPWVFSGVDLVIHAGESVGLFGGNGSGKSTLLKILATLHRPSAGSLQLFGEDIDENKESMRRRIRFLGHEKQLYRMLTVAENLKLVAVIRGVRWEEKVLKALLEKVGLGRYRDRRIDELSEGLKKRVVLARMILGEADLFLLDEPHPTLDHEGKQLLNSLIVGWQSQGKTLVIASHDHEQVRALTGRTLTMENGRLKDS